MTRRNIALAGNLLYAYQRGEDGPEARAGAMLMAAGILAQIPEGK